MQKTIQVLSTKTLTALQRGLFLHTPIRIIEHDFSSITPIKIEQSSFTNHAIITSKNAVFSLLKQQKLQQLKDVFCVGEKTAMLLKEQGIKVLHIAKNAKALALFLIENHAKECFTYFCSSIRQEELPLLLKKHHIAIKEIITYKTTLEPKEIQTTLDGVLFYSPSLVDSFLQKNTLQNTTAFCIGKTTANSVLKQDKNASIRVIETPSIENLINHTIAYYN